MKWGVSILNINTKSEWYGQRTLCYFFRTKHEALTFIEELSKISNESKAKLHKL